MEIPIALITDETFAPYCATAIASVLRNTESNTELSFYILTAGLSQIVKEKLNGLKSIKDCSINFVHINRDDFKGLSQCYHIPVESYYRFKLFSLFPELDRLLYLDSDIVVIKDIGELFNIDIAKHYVAMVSDAAKRIGSVVSDVKAKLQIPSDSDYFNAGVMLVNLKKCREHNIEQRLFEWARENQDRITWADQDVINVVMNRAIKELPEQYNVQLTCPDPALVERKVIHYCGPNKPWNTRGMFLSEYFWEHYYPFMVVCE